VTTSLSEGQVEQYRRDGYLCPLTVLSAGQAAHYRAALEVAEAAAGGSLPGPYRHKPHLVYGWAQELIRQPAILDAVEGIIGPDILAWETVFFTKEPRTSDFISWHQDITYWGLDQEGDVVTAWLALSPSTPESGCGWCPGPTSARSCRTPTPSASTTCYPAARRSRSRSTRTTPSTWCSSPARCRCTT
jgi:non-heme Fe2+,alpha-ketoglutarate-dependent halogenase